MYINTTTLETLTLSGLRRAHPHMSFPTAGPDTATLASLGYAEVTAVDAPTITESQTVAEGVPEEVDGAWRQTWVVTDLAAEAVAANLTTAKAAACANIDARAEALRAAVLTPGSGQSAEYYLTHSEAVQYLAVMAAGQTPAEANYPCLLAEQAALAATTGSVTLSDVATAVMADVNASKTALAAIKRARRAGKLAVRAATEAVGVEQAETAVPWPSPTGTA